jgi:uncharacterized Ntn-hydrolase superfamily protein
MTYSIVARDAESGELGVAVQSRAFGVGRVVPWAAAGVGAVATQSLTEASYGVLGLELMRAGKAPAAALAALVTADELEAVRQVGMVDAEGRVAVHTGAECLAEAGHATGDGYSVQANMMRSDRVWPAMAEAFEGATGALAERLLAALDAAEAAGGDYRGRQSAALLVVEAEGKGRPWEERIADLRVEDHPEPLAELRRLRQLEAAYRSLWRSERDRAATAEAAGMSELDVRWARILDAANDGEVETARALLQPLLDEQPLWANYVRLLGARGLLPDSDRLLSAG